VDTYPSTIPLVMSQMMAWALQLFQVIYLVNKSSIYTRLYIPENIHVRFHKTASIINNVLMLPQHTVFHRFKLNYMFFILLLITPIL